MPHGPAGLVWDLVALDHASPAYLRVSGAADKASAAVARNAKAVGGATQRMASAGSVLTKRLTLPLAALGAVGVSQAAKFQTALNTVAVATDKTSAQMSQAGKGIERIGATTGTGLEQLTDAFYVAAKGGYSVAKSLQITEAAAKGAKAENADLGTVANALTSIMASYGKKLGDPVKAMNLIIRGAGLAKTNLQDFANSLSNVVPVASSLGVSFSDVAAAIATMTQHGETAQHATDNLRNLITNLAGQNNVASQAMQQLGINTVDLSTNLGKRGLVGSLDYVLARIAKFRGKDGTVVVDTFKKAGLATASLNAELGTMNGTLKTQSEGLLSNKVSIKDYSAFAKSLGGQTGASALQFLALYKNSYGFSNLIKSGKGNVQSYASALQKMLGGITGMNVALQLSGESTETFHRNAVAIAKAARDGGGDVLGWAKTQNTFAVKVDKAKASLQILAVEIGTALIPAMQKIVGWVSKAVRWFDGLDGTQKKIIGWSAGVLVALGPILSLGSKFAMLRTSMLGFVGSSTARMASLAGASASTAQRLVGIARTFTQTLGGLGGGLLGSQFGGNNTRGYLTSILIGSGTGALLGGGVGALVGGLSAAAFKLVGSFDDTGDAAKRAQAQYEAALIAGKQRADDFAGALRESNGLLNDSVKMIATQHLLDSGALQKFSGLGFDPKQVVNAALGRPASRGAVTTKLDRLFSAGTIDLKTYQDLASALGQVATDAAAAQQNVQIENDALGKSTILHRKLAIEVKKYGTGLAVLSSDVRLSGDAVVDQTAAGQENTAWIRAQLTGMKQSAEWSYKHGKSAEFVTDKYTKQRDALEKTLVKNKFNKATVDALITTYGKLPRDIVTKTKVDKTNAVSTIASLQNKIDSIKQRRAAGLLTDPTHASAKIRALQGQIDAIKQKYVPKLNLNNDPALTSVRQVSTALDTLFARILAPPKLDLPTGINPNSPTLPRNGGLIGAGATGTGTRSPTITINQTFNNSAPEAPSKQGPAGMRRAALALGRAI